MGRDRLFTSDPVSSQNQAAAIPNKRAGSGEMAAQKTTNRKDKGCWDTVNSGRKKKWGAGARMRTEASTWGFHRGSSFKKGKGRVIISK